MKQLLIQVPDKKVESITRLLNDWGVKVAEVKGVQLEIKPIQYERNNKKT